MWYVTDRDYIAHYGTKRHSGRYPYGSGDRPYQSNPTMAKRNAEKSQNQKSVGTIGSSNTSSKFQLSDKQKKMLKTGAIALGVAVAAVGAYELGRYSNIKQRAGKAAAQKALNEIRKQTTDMMKNYDFSTEFGNRAYESDKKQAISKIVSQNRKEYQQLTKNAWKEDLSKQFEKLKRGPNDAYEKALKKQGNATDAIERYAASNYLDLNSINSNRLTELQDMAYDALDKIKNRRAA